MKGVILFALVILLQGVLPQENSCSGTGYSQLLCMSFLFYEAQRSGVLPADRRVTWRQDSALGDGSDNGVDLTGGYYDAGDHVKFGFPLAFTTTLLSWSLIDYADAYESTGQRGYAEDAINWSVDYMKRSYVGSNTIWGQVGDGDADHQYWGRPEDMTMERPSFKLDEQSPGTELAAETAAAFAAASLVFGDVELLGPAEELFAFADEFRGTYHESIPAYGFYTSGWSGYSDELTWAALWLYRATGNEAYLTKAKALWDEFYDKLSFAETFSWDAKTPGVYALFAQLDGGDMYKTLVADYMAKVRNELTKTPGGILYLDQWGPLRYAMNSAFIAIRAADMDIDKDLNLAWAKSQADYVVGSNPLGISYIVGYGSYYPTRPHHRASSCDPIPAVCESSAYDREDANPQILYGAMVGGPDSTDQFNDDRHDWQKTEVGLDYNAGFTGVMAGLIHFGYN